MLKLIKSNLLILAMVFAIGTAVVAQTATSGKAMKRWALDNSNPSSPQWVDVNLQTQQTPTVPGDYACNDNDEVICTAEFDENINPNSPGAHTPSNVIFGDFDPLD